MMIIIIIIIRVHGSAAKCPRIPTAKNTLVTTALKDYINPLFIYLFIYSVISNIFQSVLLPSSGKSFICDMEITDDFMFCLKY
jgi:hypothetical protein